MDKKQSSIFYLDTCSIVGNAMLLLLEKTGRKVLNSAQVEAYKYISYLNATKENFIIEEYNIIIEDLEQFFANMFYTVVTEDDYYIVLGDNVNLNDLKETFRNNLPKGQAKCFRQKNNVTALIMPDLILAEKKIEEKTL